uniref:Amino acid transporter transmembrane domain-containing protein n=1 Tax=Triticum urartu TaxID=4572 RepID=A0A8R7TI75_TRIUA
MAEAKGAAAPLLAREDGRRRGGWGGATWAQTLGNVVVSIVGTGVLGLPYAFRAAGWVAGSLGVAAAGFATLYCMLLLVDCKDKLQEEETDEPKNYTYGDFGEKCFGTIGWPMHCTSIHIPSYDAPDSRDCGDKAQIKWMLPEALPRGSWCRVARPALEPHHHGDYFNCDGILHTCIWVLRLLCWVHRLCAALLCATHLLPPQHRRIINEPMEKSAGLRLPSVWPWFCWLWNIHCSLVTLTDEVMTKCPRSAN